MAVRNICLLPVLLLVTCKLLKSDATHLNRIEKSPLNSVKSQRSTYVGPVPFVNAVVNNWGTWSPWNHCSRSCGIGVRTRIRSCITKFLSVMPGSGIRTSHTSCSGKGIEYGTCNREDCNFEPNSGHSFKLKQCQRYNHNKVMGKIVNNWVPHENDKINPCSLVCEGEGENITYRFGKVTDGTPCKLKAKRVDGICVNGRCMLLSCNGIIGGSKLEDMCRICGGKNETCVKRVGHYRMEPLLSDQPVPGAQEPNKMSSKRYKYYEVIKIPIGSTNILVKDDSINYLALKRMKKYFLNGNWLIDWPGNVEVGRTTFKYIRHQNQSERLSSLGPTDQEVTVMVLLKDENSTVSYEFWEPKEVMKLKELTYTSLNPETKSLANTHISAIYKPTFITSVEKLKENGMVFDENGKKRKNTLYLNKFEENGNIDKNISLHGKTSKSETALKIKGKSKNMHKMHRSINSNINDLKMPLEFKHLKQISNKRKHYLRHRHFGENSIYPRYPLNKTKVQATKGIIPKWQYLYPIPIDDKFSLTNTAKKKRRKNPDKKTRKENRSLYCRPCRRKKMRTTFCRSDFAIRAKVLREKQVKTFNQFEIKVEQSYKNKLPLLPKEFVWTSLCSCSSLKPGKTYLIIGKAKRGRGNEVKLILEEDAFIKRFSWKLHSRMKRIRNKEFKLCHSKMKI